MTTLFIPSPSSGVWNLGPLPLRGYALCIIAGIIAAIWIGERRWVGRGGLRGEVTDLALWAVPFGVIGGRIYHVITDHDLYFGDDRSPIQALYVWRGGLGIWGAIALGGVGVWLGAKSKGIRVPPVLDAMAPGVLVAQAMGRWGNWFNQELFGKPSTQPWALKIDPENRPPGYEQYATFQPTFLYECLWDLGAFGFVIWADRRFKLGHGRVLALYVMAYTAGRGWIEMLRIDDVEYQHVLGLRLNVWTSIVLFCLAATYFVVVGRKRPGREAEVYTDKRLAADAAAAAEGESAAAGSGEASKSGSREKDADDAKAGQDPEATAEETKAGSILTATKLLETEPEPGTAAKKAAPAKKAPATKAATAKAAAQPVPDDGAAVTEPAVEPAPDSEQAPVAKKAAAKKAPAKKAPAKKAPAKKAPVKKTAVKKAPPKKMTPRSASPHPASPEAATPEAATPEAATPEAATPEAATPEAAPSEKPRTNRTDTPE